ncbi:MAG: response regulator transcription factor [Gammaproteobacteria bacterium]|nr:response regulator transcription factor [Gammaproteobacteria bacterium]
MRILLIEDDELLGDGIKTGLKQDGHTVEWVKDGLTAESVLLRDAFDAVILDISLPKKSGLEVLKAVRLEKIQTPILVLTAHDSVEDRIKGLDSGADDYLTKPFNLHELNARLRALSRRSLGRVEPSIQYGPITLDPAAHTVKFHDEEVKMSRREYALIFTLLENQGKVISRHQIIDSLYGWNEEIDSNALEVHIHHLRKKFGNNFIHTIRGVGYMVQKPE